MKLVKITVNNFRSIDSIDLDVIEIEDSYTYSLLGINESGKSSILKAISFIDDIGATINYPLDFHDENKPISIKLVYYPTKRDIKELHEHLEKKNKFDKVLIGKIKVTRIEITVECAAEEGAAFTIDEKVEFETAVLPNYTLEDSVPVLKTKGNVDAVDLDLTSYFKTYLDSYFWGESHHVVFWKSSPEYLILDEIDLTQFAADPAKVSVPLHNCFILAGYKTEDLQKEIRKLNSAVSRASLQAKLSKSTTAHINKVWPEHPISISFDIDSNKISLLIEDNDVMYKPKTTGQRSDGFKQFISFLLTVSAESYNGELENTILLIDEPETHLHPPAQLNLLNELIKITSNQNNNILFFATHSNYLIDKDHLDRNYKVFKSGNEKTKLERIQKKKSSYAEVNYEVFGILSTDYHNELYGYVELENVDLLNELPKDRKWYNKKVDKTYQVSLPVYIRHSIHHPENKENKKYTEKELEVSTRTLIALKEKIEKLELPTAASKIPSLKIREIQDN